MRVIQDWPDVYWDESIPGLTRCILRWEWSSWGKYPGRDTSCCTVDSSALSARTCLSSSHSRYGVGTGSGVDKVNTWFTSLKSWELEMVIISSKGRWTLQLFNVVAFSFLWMICCSFKLQRGVTNFPHSQKIFQSVSMCTCYWTNY